jgi:formate dehydrogenase iron-sulfur subunit
MATFAQCYDSQSCIRCFACMVGCGTENQARLQRDAGVPIERASQQVAAHLFHIAPRAEEIGRYPDARRITGFAHCRHCENAPCASVCPTQAIVKRPTGTVVIRENLCIGCQSCRDACPFDVPQYSKARNKTYKCTGCFDRVEAGLKPACVAACPTGAMFSGSPDAVAKEARERAERYSKTLGIAHVVYGDQAVNGTTGRLGWMTIAPQRDAAFYDLPADPSRPWNTLREVAKVGGAVAAAGMVVGVTAHWLGWLSKRRQEVAADRAAAANTEDRP